MDSWAEFGLGLGEDVHKDDHEQQVDEVHGFCKTNGQEEVGPCFVFDFWLSSNRCDCLATGQTVTDGCTDGAALRQEVEELMAQFA